MSESESHDVLSVLRSTSMPTVPSIEPAAPSFADLDSQLVELFFDRVPMGIALFGTDLRLQRCNRTWTTFYEHYLGVGPEYTAPGRHIFELIPGNEESVQPLFENALAGRVVRQAAHRISIPGVETYWDVVFAPLYRGEEIVGVIDIVTDATDRVHAIGRLQARIDAFRAVAAGMSVDLPLRATLQQVADAVCRTTDAVACLARADPAAAATSDARTDEALVVWAGQLGPAPGTSAVQSLGGAAGAGPDEPVLVLRDFRSGAVEGSAASGLEPWLSDSSWEDLVAVEVAVSGTRVGQLLLCLPAATRVTPEDETFLRALADQTATAVQNAALFHAAGQNATLLERQRLSRELHDSVSQALFSMTLHTRAAERHFAVAGGSPEDPVGRELDRLRVLAQGALAEMRALIFELRPGALAEEGLAAALTKQAAALSAREQLPVRVHAPAERVPLPAPVEEHLYRLALEALHNALKHARATRLDVVLDHDLSAGEGPTLALEVRDDGVGFDPAELHPGHLGLRTMRERAQAVGGALDVVSGPAGTTVRLRLPLAQIPAT